ncbi:MAG: hypothetical protein R6U25_08135, partial [Alkalispirochaeta sp.]
SAFWRTQIGVVILAVGALAIAGCVDVTTPETAAGRSAASDPPLELLIFHGQAETLSTVTLDPRDGAIESITENVQELGAVPNDIVLGDSTDEIMITLSGENRVLILEESTLRITDEIILPTGSNPMASVALGAEVEAARGVVATSTLFTGEIFLSDRAGGDWKVLTDGAGHVDLSTVDTTLPVNLPLGVAPQALVSVLVVEPDTLRIIGASTAYDATRDSDNPFGEATLEEYRITASGSPQPTIEIEAVRSGYSFGAIDSTGLNPTQLTLVPARGSQPDEIVVVGSGANLSGGSDGGGSDDGRLIVLDRGTLAVREELTIGGSPGSIAMYQGSEGTRIFLAGPAGIRTVFRDNTDGWTVDPSEESLVYKPAVNSLALIADVAVYSGTTSASLYATDYWESKLLRFEIGEAGALSLEQSFDMPQGPQGMLIVDETESSP